MEDEKKTVDPVPYFVHEGAVTRMENCNRRLLMALVVALLALFLNNIVWLVYEGVTHHEKEVTAYEQEADPRPISE